MYQRLLLRGLLPAVLATSSLAGLAEAADLGPYPAPREEWRGPAYYPGFRWTGLYAGLQGGYGWGNTGATWTALDIGTREGFSYPTSGALGGLHAGYNWQVGSLVLGLETDIEASGIAGSGFGSFGSVQSTNVDWLGSLRGRLGYAAGRTLFYVTGGLAYGSVSIDRSLAAGFVPFSNDSTWRTGWTVGGGIEHALSPHISLRLEYRYTDLGSVTFTNPGLNISDTTDITHSAVRAGLSFRF